MAYIPKFVLILFFIITADYFLAQQISNSTGKKRKFFLILSIFVNLGTLFFFKYFNFFNENIASIANLLHWNYPPIILQIALPLGLSFHVFQSLSYVIEVYKEKYKPEKNYISYALYVMFFPQLVAGPIERPQHLLPQINTVHTFDYIKARRGLERILWGFFKKLVIADQLSRVISYFFQNNPLESTTLIFVMILFAYQLYCDFSGYSDIAVGSAMLLGFELTENFDRPFSAKSIAEFWRRWHISLSNWLRDYLYYPLAFAWKKNKLGLYAALLITFTLIGLWHGANWTYVVFGALQGIYMVIGTITEKGRKRIADIIGLTKIPKLHGAIKVVIVFMLFVISLIFFRAENMYQAVLIIKYIFTVPNISLFLSNLMMVKGSVFAAITAIIFMEIIQYIQTKKKLYMFLNQHQK
jgi:D-alanyl-lipoteichoic acid acyltransferase DltB (MBOAT superfamily)